MTERVIIVGKDGSRRVFEMRQNYIDVSTMGCTERDPRWSYTDRAGHEHHYEPTGAISTVGTVLDPEYFCPDCHDIHSGDSREECLQCGEVIMPGTRPASSAYKRIAGMAEHLIDGEYVTYDEFKAAYESARADL